MRLIIPAAFAARPGDSLQILLNGEVKLPGAAATAVDDEAAWDKGVFGSWRVCHEGLYFAALGKLRKEQKKQQTLLTAAARFQPHTRSPHRLYFALSEEKTKN